MARGGSGRIVLEIDPSQKNDLYTALTKDGLTLKSWFLRQTSLYLRDRTQLVLFAPTLAAEEPPTYKTHPAKSMQPPTRTEER
jgi:hypothetical protein